MILLASNQSEWKLKRKVVYLIDFFCSFYGQKLNITEINEKFLKIHNQKLVNN